MDVGFGDQRDVVADPLDDEPRVGNRQIEHGHSMPAAMTRSNDFV